MVNEIKTDDKLGLLMEFSARLNKLRTVHAYDKDGWGNDFIRAEDVQDLQDWVDFKIRGLEDE